MTIKANLESVYEPSTDLVARDIEGELIIIPLVSGIGDIEDELLSLNGTGRSIWDRLDGRKKLGEVVSELGAEFDEPREQIEADVVGFVSELLNRRLVVEAATA